jgi:HEAT repeat protein
VPVAEGLLAAAGLLAAEGHAERATMICERVLDLPVPIHVRMGAFRGLADADPANATDLLLGALAGDEPVFRDMAAQIVAETADDTERFAAALEELPGDGQTALLRGLAARGDRAARAAVLLAASGADPGVRAAALRALARLGTPEDVPMLIAALDGPEADAAAARDALRALEDDAVNALLAKALDAAPAPRKVALLELLGVRVAPETLPAAEAATSDPEASVRAAGLRILSDLGGADQLAAALAALTKAGSDDERTLAARATSAIASRQGEAVLGPLLVAMAETPLDARLAVLRAVAQVRTPKALEAVVTVIGSGEAEEMRQEAVRLLAAWPTADAATHLLALAQAADATHRDAALRGYVRLARGERDAAAKHAMLETAMGLASGTQEQWLVLAAWGTLHTPAALEALRPHLATEAVRNEAASAMLTVAAELAKDEAQRPAAKAALDAVLAACEDAAIRERASTARAALGE